MLVLTLTTQKLSQRRDESCPENLFLKLKIDIKVCVNGIISVVALLLFKNKRFMLDEMIDWNASISLSFFGILKLKKLFYNLHQFFSNECPSQHTNISNWHKMKGFCIPKIWQILKHSTWSFQHAKISYFWRVT